MEAVYDVPISADEIKEGLAADLLDTAWYRTSETVFEARTVEQGKNAGRNMLRVTGTLAGAEDGDFLIEEGIKGRKVFFNVSPELRYNDNGKPDFLFQMWSKLVQSVGGGSTVREITDKAKMTTLRLRVNKRERADTGDPESTVVNIRPVS